MNRRLFLSLGSTLWVPTPRRVYSFGTPALSSDDLADRIVRYVAAAHAVPAYLLDPGYIHSVRTTVRVTL